MEAEENDGYKISRMGYNFERILLVIQVEAARIFAIYAENAKHR